MVRKVIGRSIDCDFVIFDPKNRVSRKHLEAISYISHYGIKDLGSLNGTYINDKKISCNKEYKVTKSDKVTLSTDYKLDLQIVFNNEIVDVDSTKVLMNNPYHELESDKYSVKQIDDKTVISQDGKVVVIEKDKTSLAELSEIDTSPYTTIGRTIDNKIVINNNHISKNHCRIRLITPLIIEIEDLGSTNGTFADDIRLDPFTKHQFKSNVKIRLASNTHIDLKKIFNNIHIIEKKSPPVNPTPPQQNNQSITAKELNEFMQLEEVWKEYTSRQNQVGNVAVGYGIGGSIAGIVASVLLAPVTGGGSVVGILASAGGGVLGRYLGQQESNKIKNDHTYDDMFLQVYSCPRCKESFQKKPWITIRDCFKCKIKFR